MKIHIYIFAGVKVSISIIIACIFYASCSSSNSETDTNSNKQMQNFNTDLLLGDWIFTVQGDTGIESWIYANDSTLSGVSIHVKGNDTAVDEHIELRKWSDKWQYCALVADQNNGERICFNIIPRDSTTLECINKAHDFPQSITYRMVNADSMVATVSGNRNDTVRSFSIELRKVRKVSEVQ